MQECFIKSARQIMFCPFCAGTLQYNGTEDTEIWECRNCQQIIDYTNPDHT